MLPDGIRHITVTDMSAAIVARARESLLEMEGAASRKEAGEGVLLPPVVVERGGRGGGAVEVSFVQEDEEQLSCEPEYDNQMRME